MYNHFYGFQMRCLHFEFMALFEKIFSELILAGIESMGIAQL